jgi:hypothetical protein
MLDFLFRMFDMQFFTKKIILNGAKSGFFWDWDADPINSIQTYSFNSYEYFRIQVVAYA